MINTNFMMKNNKKCQKSLVWTIVPKENCPQLGLVFSLGLALKLRLGGGRFSSRAIVLELYYMNTLGSFVFSELALLTRDVLCSKR